MGCSSPSRTTDGPLKWTTNDLVGYTYNLQDTNRTNYTFEWEGKPVTITNTTRCARYTFYSNGRGNAAFGIVNGPLCPPAISWSITRTGTLAIDSGGDDLEHFILKSWDGDRVIVNTRFGTEVYIREKNGANKALQAIGDKSPQPER